MPTGQRLGDLGQRVGAWDWTADRPPRLFTNRARTEDEAAIRGNLAGAHVAEAQANEAVFRNDPYAARRRGEVAGETAGRAGMLEAQLGAETYFDPDVAQARRAEDERQQRLEEEATRRQEELYRRRYTDPAMIRAEGQRATAMYGTQGRLGSSALAALARAAGVDPMSPDAQQRVNEAFGAILPNVPGQESRGEIVPLEEIQRFASDNGMTLQQAQEYLTSRGYVVQGY